MTIAVCDDEVLFRINVIRLLEKYREDHMLSFQIAEFSSGDELLDYNCDIFLVFLDFEMPGRNGMSTARLLKQKNQDTLIVFLTSHPEMMQKAFEVKAFRYLLKPLRPHDLVISINAALKEMEQSKVVLFDNGVQKIINLKDIQYIEAGVNYTFARTEKSVFQSKNTMSEWENIVKEEHFYRCHKTYIVNIKFVDEVLINAVVLYNKEKVSLSRRNKKEFQQKLLQYIKNMAR